MGAIGYSWLDGLLRNPWSGVQTPQVLGYSGLRVAEPLVRGSNPYGAGVTLRGWGWGPTCPIRVYLGVDTGNHISKRGLHLNRIVITIGPSWDRTPGIVPH
jgi:hypothetical protein